MWTTDYLIFFAPIAWSHRQPRKVCFLKPLLPLLLCLQVATVGATHSAACCKSPTTVFFFGVQKQHLFWKFWTRQESKLHLTYRLCIFFLRIMSSYMSGKYAHPSLTVAYFVASFPNVCYKNSRRLPGEHLQKYARNVWRPLGKNTKVPPVLKNERPWAVWKNEENKHRQMKENNSRKPNMHGWRSWPLLPRWGTSK